MTFRNAVFAVCLLLFTGTQVNVHAVEALSTEELVSHCKVYNDDAEGVDGIFCVRYIQGFIDGAVATDERVALNVASEYEKEETLTQRAIRTRLGSRIKRFGPSYYAEFCLGEPLPLAEVARVVIADLVSIKDVKGRELARDVVYATLRREYPCQASDE